MAISDLEDDRGLALRAAGGDERAFEDLYRRYGQPLFDLAVRTTHDLELGTGAVQTTFMRAWDALRQSPAPKNVRAWLFGLGRGTIIDAIRHRSIENEDTGGESVDYARLDPGRLADPAPVAGDRELVYLVWDAASDLSPSDYMLLDMNLRQGLTPEDLAEALGMRQGALYLSLSQAKNTLEETVTYTLLLRRGRKDCPELDSLLAGADEYYVDPGSRQVIDRHLADCETCSERQLRYPSPAAVFAALAPIAMPAPTEQALWNGLAEYVQRSDLVPIGGRIRPRIPGRALAGAAAALLVLILGVRFITTPRAAIHDPADVHSTSHQLGQGSDSRTVTINWTPDPDAEAYATKWSQQPRDVPDAVAVLSGSATSTTSPPLEPGTWYFHLRTEGRGGQWTSTVHLGPFVISPPTDTPTPEPTAAPTQPVAVAPAATATPEPPTATATPARPTATPTRAATATATRTSTATAVPKPSAPPPTATPPAPPKPAVSAPPASAAPACATAFGNATLSATTGSGNRVALNWTSGGGCGPYKGTISARYQQDSAPYTTYTISSTAGSLTDSPPVRCQGSYPVVYSLTLQDSAGQSTTASSGSTVVWTC
jgi:RNA polymerase sigma factor (sigma-70 family)